MWGQQAAAKQAEEIARMMAKKQGKVLLADDKSTSKSSLSKSMASPPSVIRLSDNDDSSSELSLTEKSSIKGLGPVLPHFKAELYLKKIQAWVEEKTKREQDLYGLISNHKELAKARYVNDNEVGAMLSMKRVLKLQHERDQLVLALDKATDAIMEIETAADQARTAAAMDRAQSDNVNKSLWYKVEIGESNACILSEVQSMVEQSLDFEVSKEETRTALHAL